MKRRTFVRSSIAAAMATTLPARRLLGEPYAPWQQVPPDVDAITGTGREITLKGSDVADLAARLKGRLLLGGDEGYEDARRILTPSFDRHPALIAQVTGTAPSMSSASSASV